MGVLVVQNRGSCSTGRLQDHFIAKNDLGFPPSSISLVLGLYLCASMHGSSNPGHLHARQTLSQFQPLPKSLVVRFQRCRYWQLDWGSGSAVV